MPTIIERIVKRLPPLTIDEVTSRLIADMDTGQCYWIDPSKYHPQLEFAEAGCARKNTHSKKSYWIIKLKSLPHKRAYIMFLLAHGYWPSLIDHIDGNSLNDSPKNLREATATQNAWNHRGRTKKSGLPMGVRMTKNGKFDARIACHKHKIHIGTFETLEGAHRAYLKYRKQYFGPYSGL